MGGFLSIGTCKHRFHELGSQGDHGWFLAVAVAAPRRRCVRVNRLISWTIAALGTDVLVAGFGKEFGRLEVQCDNRGFGLLLTHDDDKVLRRRKKLYDWGWRWRCPLATVVLVVAVTAYSSRFVITSVYINFVQDSNTVSPKGRGQYCWQKECQQSKRIQYCTTSYSRYECMICCLVKIAWANCSIQRHSCSHKF